MTSRVEMNSAPLARKDQCCPLSRQCRATVLLKLDLHRQPYKGEILSVPMLR